MAPSIDIEHILSVIWAELLNIEAEKLGITDNFPVWEEIHFYLFKWFLVVYKQV